MNLQIPRRTSDVFSSLWPWFFFTAAFESLLAAIALVLIPSENGISVARLGVLALLAAFFFTGIYLGFNSRHQRVRFDLLARSPVIISSALLVLISNLLLFLLLRSSVCLVN
ncbi:MAG: hypothetical protein IPJ46_11840 [Anaerolineales bacterium]|nr:hypothetical protein [Anaerolineales bacterium]